jgi:hypothetical protein
MRELSKKLKANGQIALIDYKEDASFLHFGHNVSREEILSSIQDTGLEIENEFDFLEKQYFFIIKKQ